MYIRDLGDVDAPALRALACVNSKRDWEMATQEMVSVWLPDMLGEGRVAAAGGFEDDELVAVVSWASTDRDDTWVCLVLAVRLGRQRRGAGRLMKQYLIEQARSHGIRAIRSVVHRDNKAVWALNERLGGRFATDDPYKLWYQCVVPVD